MYSAVLRLKHIFGLYISSKSNVFKNIWHLNTCVRISYGIRSPTFSKHELWFQTFYFFREDVNLICVWNHIFFELSELRNVHLIKPGWVGMVQVNILKFSAAISIGNMMYILAKTVLRIHPPSPIPMYLPKSKF